MRIKVRGEQVSKILLEKREKESFGKNHIALSSDRALQRKLQRQTARSPRRDSLTKTSTDSRPYTHHRQPLSAARSTSSPSEKSPQRLAGYYVTIKRQPFPMATLLSYVRRTGALQPEEFRKWRNWRGRKLIEMVVLNSFSFFFIYSNNLSN